MKKLFLVIGVTFLLSACGGTKSDPNSNSSANDAKPAASSAEKVKVGDTVAFVSGHDGLAEGKIDSMDGARYKIKYGDSMETKDESDIYPLPKSGVKPQVKAGDMVAAKMESGAYWAGSEVLSVSDDVIEVKGLYYGRTASLAPDKIIVVRAPQVADFKKLKSEKDFSAKAKAMRPQNPAGWKPKVGDRVVAEWSAGSWWVGEVTGLAGSMAKLKWPSSFPASELSFDKLAPLPKAGATMPAVDSFVLVKPDSDSGQWQYAQVTAVNGQSADIKFADGKTRSIKAGEYIALS